MVVTPNGMVFVKPAVRKSLLAKMLGEILDTRVMVKQAMKGAKGDKVGLYAIGVRTAFAEIVISRSFSC
jgi:DNA polymerase zeta